MTSTRRYPGFWNALRVPFNLASVLYIVPSSLLLVIFVNAGLLGVFGGYLLLVWLFKYGYVLLEQIANGATAAPAVDQEMLSPFEARPLLQAMVCGGIYIGGRAAGVDEAWVLVGMLVCLLPASMAVLGLNHGLLQAANPLLLWRVTRALGIRYVAILGLIGIAACTIALMVRLNAWSVLHFAIAQIAILMVFSGVGGALFERREQLGFQPRSSPEREMAARDGAHARELNVLLDQMYTSVRMNRHGEVPRPLETFVSGAEERHVRADALEILRRAGTWRDAAAVSLVATVLVKALRNRGLGSVAREVEQGAPPA